MEGNQHSRRLSVSGLLMADDLINLDELADVKDTGFLVDPEIFKASPPKIHSEGNQSSVPAAVQDGSPGEPQVRKRKSKRNKLRNSMAWDQAFQNDDEPLLLQELEAIDIITLSESHTPPRTTKRPNAISIPRKKSFEAEAMMSARDRTSDVAPFAELQSNMPIPSAGPSPKPLVKSERRKKGATTESMAWNKAFQEEIDEELLMGDLPLSESPVLQSKRKESSKVSELCESSDSCFTVSQQKEQLSSKKEMSITEGVLETVNGQKADATSSQAMQSLLSSFESLRTEASTSSVAWYATASIADEAESEAKQTPNGQSVRSALQQALTPGKGTPSKGERRRRQPVSLHRPSSTTVAIESAIQHGTKLRLPGRYNPNPPPKPSSKTPESSGKEVLKPTSNGESAKQEGTTRSASKSERSNVAAAVDWSNDKAQRNEREEPQKASEDMKALQAQLAAIQLERDSLQAKLEALSEGKGSSDAKIEAAGQKLKEPQEESKGGESRRDGAALKQPMLGFQSQAKTGHAPKLDASKARVSPQLLSAVTKEPSTASVSARPSFLKKPSAKKDFFQGTSSVTVRQSPSVQKVESDGPAQPKASAGVGAPKGPSKCSFANGKPSPETSLLKRPSLLRKPSDLRTIKGSAFSTSAIQAACSVPLPSSPGLASPSPAKKQASPATSRLSRPGSRNPQATKPLESASTTAVKLATTSIGQSKIPTFGSSRLKPPGFKASSIAPEIIVAACSVPLPSSPKLPRGSSSVSTATIAPKLTRGSLLKPPSSLLKAACAVPLPTSPEKMESLKPCASETPAVEPEIEQKEPVGGHTLGEEQTIVTGLGENGILVEEQPEVTAVEPVRTPTLEKFGAIETSEEQKVKAAAGGVADKEAAPKELAKVLPADSKKETLVESEAVQNAQASVVRSSEPPLTATSVKISTKESLQAVDPCQVSPSEAPPSEPAENLPIGFEKETVVETEVVQDTKPSSVLSSELSLTASPTKEAPQAVDPCHVSPSEASESYPSLQLPSSSCLQPRRLSKKPGLPTIYSPALVAPKGDQMAEEGKPRSPAARALFSSTLGRAARVNQEEEQVESSKTTEKEDNESENVGSAIENSSATEKKSRFAETGENESAQASEVAADKDELMRPVEMFQGHSSTDEDASTPSKVLGTERTGSGKDSEEPVGTEIGGNVKATAEEEASVDATGAAPWLSISGEASSQTGSQKPGNLEQGADSSAEPGVVFAFVEEETVSKIEAQNFEEGTSEDEPTEGSKSLASVVLSEAPSESAFKAEDLPTSAFESPNNCEASTLALNSEKETSASEEDAVKAAASTGDGDQEGLDMTLGSPESGTMSHEDAQKLLQLEAVLLGALQQEQVSPGGTVELGGSLSEALGKADDVSESALGYAFEMQRDVKEQVGTAAAAINAAAVSCEAETAADVSSAAAEEETAPGSTQEVTRGSSREEADVSRGGAQADSAQFSEAQAGVRKAELEGVSAAAESASDVIKRLRARQAAVAALLDSPCKELSSKSKDEDQQQKTESESLGGRVENFPTSAEEKPSATAPSQEAKLLAPPTEREASKDSTADKVGMPQKFEAAREENGEVEPSKQQSTSEEAASPKSNGKLEKNNFGETKTESLTMLPALAPAHSPGHVTSSECKESGEMTTAEGESTTSVAVGKLIASVSSPVSAAWEEAWFGTPIGMCPGEETGEKAVRSEKTQSDAPKPASLGNEAWGEIDAATPTESEAFPQEKPMPKINGPDALSPNTPNLLSLAIPLFPNPETLSRQTLETRFEAHVEDETKALWDECLAKVRGKKRTSPCGQLRTSVGKKKPMRRSAEDLLGVAALRSSPPGTSPVSILSRTPGRLRHALSESAPGLGALMQSMMEARGVQPGTVKSSPAVLASPAVKARGKAPGRKKKPLEVSWEEHDLDARIRAIEALGEEGLASKSGRVQSSPPDKKDEVPANPYSPVKKRECGPFDCTKRTDIS